ncbi:hypothetical protein EDB92DRAFT_1821996 [Lactarius akahatsu]|uniref:Uncharacterized protein n=1 Tax=Lactarius akahatsu TaxID=416441 RepID=A0AAD4L5W6_9AGAM|nr:hypothetical protein EDB92DRAFT_1821996 [Lactarius akahatsu]
MEHRAAADDDMAWVDTFILNTRRTGGRQTETSVLKMYKASNCALRAGVVPDAVVDANHKIHYLKYATTRCLLTKGGKEKETDERLSACPTHQSLKKIVTMLGRIRRRQQDSNPDLVQDRPASNYRCQDYIKSVMVEARRLRIHSPQQLTLPTSRLRSANFDVTKGTILEYELHPEQFMEVTAAIFDMDQGTSVFCTCTSPSDLRPSRLSSVHHQSATLNRGDKLVNLPLAFLQPYGIRVADFNRSNGRPAGVNRAIFGVLSMFWDTKTANADVRSTYSLVLVLFLRS